MKTLRAKVVVGTILSALITLGVAPAVFARSIGAYAGNPLDNSSRTACFTETGGAVAGTPGTGCTGRWEVNLPIDNSGSWTVSFTGKGTGGIGGVSCGAYAVDASGNITNTTYQGTNASTFTSVTLSSINVAAGGNLFIACQGLTFGVLGTINWNQ